MPGVNEDNSVCEPKRVSLAGEKSISVIIPTLNEAATIALLLVRLDRALSQEGIAYEAIVIDDHSSDDTAVIAETLARERNLPVCILTKQGQPGKAFSLMEGFAVAQFDTLAMIDGDLQYPPEALPEMMRQLAHADIVVADRRKSYGTVNHLRGALSHIFTDIIVSTLFGIDTDMQSGLKVFHRNIYEDVPGSGSWSFDLHLITRAASKGATVTNVPITFYERQSGKSKVAPLVVGMELLVAAIQLKMSLVGRRVSSKSNNSWKEAMQHNFSSQDESPSLKLATDGIGSDDVIHYRAWLRADARPNAANAQEQFGKYRDEALRAVSVRGKQVMPFAPFRHKHSAIQTLTSGQAITISVLILAVVLGLVLLGTTMVVAVAALVTGFYLSDLLLNFWLATRTLSQSMEEQIDDVVVQALADADWPRYAILCPLYREVTVLHQFVQAMQALDYPTDKLQILLLTEEDDSQMRQSIRTMHLPAHFSTLTVPTGFPRTKPRACNFGLLQATGDYVVIYDAEDIPDPLQLKKAVLTFANHDSDLACVQAKLNFYNPRQNLLTRWFTAEYSSWFDLLLPGLQQRQLPIPLGGTSNHFRTDILRALGAWDAFNVTEDCDLGLRLARYHLKTVILDSTTYEEANSRLKNWLRQRSRWIKGYMQTYLVNMRQPLRYVRQGRLNEFFWLQVLLGGKTAVLFVNPVMWAMLAIYICLRPIVGDTYHSWFPAPVFYMGTICLVFGNFFYMYTHLIGCLKRDQYGLIKWALFIPFYWALMSVAAFIALYQLIIKPHFWEKTHHGFHLHTPSSKASSIPVKTPVGPASPLSSKLKNTQSHISLSTEHQAERHRAKASWLIAVLVAAGLTSSISWSTLFQRHAKQGQHGHIKWAMFTPFSWGLMSIALFLALPQRILKSQYHRKTWSDSSRRLPQSSAQSTSVTDALKLVDITRPSALEKVTLHSAKRPKRSVWRSWFEDRWLVATLVIACLASITSLGYFFYNGQIMLYTDGYAHLVIGRRLIDNATPGFAQLGGVWLPLQHLLMQPFIWNDFLWRTGLAGSIPSMMCYVIAAIYLFLSARRLTKDSRASFVGTLLFIVNPNILYLQSTPLSELAMIATLTIASYYFLAWVQDDKPKQLIWAAVTIFLATMTRYDGWFLFLVMLIMIPLIGWIKHQPWGKIEGNLLVFGTLGGLGIALWFLWCGVIFGDPLYFQSGPYSAQAQQQGLIKANMLPTNHNLWQSLRYYLFASGETLGPILLVLSIIAVILFLFRQRLSASALGALTLLAPVAFYVVSLYEGQAVIYVPGAVASNAPTQLFNARYGAMAVAPAALFLGTLSSKLNLKKGFLQSLGQGVLVLAIAIQTILTASGGIITLQDGQYGGSCAPLQTAAIYLAQHYNGGRILEDFYTSQVSQFAEAGLDFKDIIYEGSGSLWKQALKNPAAMVDWVVVNPTSRGDLVAQSIDVKKPAFLSKFTRVVEEPSGLMLFHRNGLPPLPTKPLPPHFLTDHRLCGAGTSRAFSTPSPLTMYRGAARVWIREGAVLDRHL